MRHQQVVAGIDIGGTNTIIGLVSSEGIIIERRSFTTSDFADPRDFVEQAVQIIFEMLKKSKEHLSLKGIGIGAPNGNYYSGKIEFAPNLIWKGEIPLAKMFKDKLKVPVALTNDANAATLGEMMFGGAKNIKDFLFVTLGTGLGSGIVANGELIYGHDGFAGEIGHVIVIPNGRKCGCGRNGCLETYCSATGIVNTYLEIAGDATDKSINSIRIFQLAKEGDKIAKQAFEKTGEILGLALANSVTYTSPSIIFLFGGLTHAGDLIFKPTIQSFENNLLEIYKNKIPIVPSKLPESDAAILGAASLIWKN